MKLEIKTFISNFLDVNSYVINNKVLVDPCIDYRVIAKYENFNLEAVFITHGHIDHIMMIDTYLKVKNLKFYMHRKTYDKLLDPSLNLSRYVGGDKKFLIPEEQIVFVNDGMKILIDDLEFKIIETPGHSNCSICILVDDAMFSGDTLFKETIGRTDLVTSNSASILKSLKRLVNLKTNYNIYPGHGEATSLDYEKKYNPYL